MHALLFASCLERPVVSFDLRSSSCMWRLFSPIFHVVSIVTCTACVAVDRVGAWLGRVVRTSPWSRMMSMQATPCSHVPFQNRTVSFFIGTDPGFVFLCLGFHS